MTYKLPELPYPTDGLSPFLSKETLETHYEKHHRGYVRKLDKLVEGTTYAGQSMQDTVLLAHSSEDTGVFNNAAQILNHTFLWNSMSPDGGGAPSGPLAGAIETSFGSRDKFDEAFRKAASSRFGSGWVWLVMDGEHLRVISTGDADTPIVRGMVPLLTLDVWEHAYYLDYKNERARYVDAFLSDAVNWSFAADNFTPLYVSS